MKIEAGAIVTPSVRLLRPLGEGGMGSVWVAEHTGLGTEVAVKFLQGEYAQDANARARFSQEAAAASQVKSSHVVKVYDYGITSSDVPFIVMEMLEGTDLAKRIEAEKTLPPLEVLTIVNQLCKALARAHEKGVIHRDVKPENVFLGSEGGEVFVKLLDFGIAKTEKLLRKTTGNRQSTLAGESLGTPYYMSPEQFRSAKQIDARSDLWSVGVVVYEALTGALPFVADSVGALAITVNEGKFEPPSKVNTSLPESIDAWFAKACAHDPADRFQTARELSSALSVALGASPPPATADASTSGPQRVVIAHRDSLHDTESSLRDTAFATSGGGTQQKRPFPRTLAIGLGAGVLVVAGVAWTVARSSSPASASSASQTSTAASPSVVPSEPSTISPANPSASATLATTTAQPTPSAATTAASTAGAHVTTHTTTSHSATPTQPAPSASSSGKGNHHDIW